MLDILAYAPIFIFFLALYAVVFWLVPMSLDNPSGEGRGWRSVVMLHIAAVFVLWLAWGLSRLTG